MKADAFFGSPGAASTPSKAAKPAQRDAPASPPAGGRARGKQQAQGAAGPGSGSGDVLSPRGRDVQPQPDALKASKKGAGAKQPPAQPASSQALYTPDDCQRCCDALREVLVDPGCALAAHVPLRPSLQRIQADLETVLEEAVSSQNGNVSLLVLGPSGSGKNLASPPMQASKHGCRRAFLMGSGVAINAWCACTTTHRRGRTAHMWSHMALAGPMQQSMRMHHVCSRIRHASDSCSGSTHLDAAVCLACVCMTKARRRQGGCCSGGGHVCVACRSTQLQSECEGLLQNPIRMLHRHQPGVRPCLLLPCVRPRPLAHT